MKQRSLFAQDGSGDFDSVWDEFEEYIHSVEESLKQIAETMRSIFMQFLFGEVPQMRLRFLASDAASKEHGLVLAEKTVAPFLPVYSNDVDKSLKTIKAKKMLEILDKAEDAIPDIGLTAIKDTKKHPKAKELVELFQNANAVKAAASLYGCSHSENETFDMTA